MSETEEDAVVPLTYLVGIGIEGYEFAMVIDERYHMLGRLGDPNHKPHGDIWALSLRIRMNSHRRIVTYVVSLPIEPDDIHEYMDNEPLLELIKERGKVVNLV